MGMPDTARRYTVEEVLAFPDDGNRYELVDGELLVTPAPSPWHQLVLSRLFARLSRYLDRHEGVEILWSPADIRWPGESVVQPDLFVVPTAEVTRDRWSSIRTLLLAVEVISPGSGRADRVVKRRAYQRHGVATYWAVDPDARVVEVWRPADERPEVVTDVLGWRVAPEAPELVIALEELLVGSE